MRRIILGICLLVECALMAQNGITIIPMPGFFNPNNLRNKNCITTDNNGKVYIGTRDIGVIGWDGNIWDYYDATNGLTDNKILCIFADPNGLLWIGTDTGGVCVFNGATWGNFSTWNSGIPSHKILSIAKQGTDLWVGTNRGLAKYDGINWSVYNTQNSGLPSDTVNEIAFSSTGEILAATARGLIRFNNSTWTGLWPTTNVWPIDHIYVHTDGTEWIATQSSLFKNTATGFSAIDNLFEMPSSTFNVGVKIIGKGPNGGVSFCTAHGALNEIIGEKINTFYPIGLVNSMNSSEGLFKLNTLNNEFWLINHFASSSNSIQNNLLLFDCQLYNGLGKGITAFNNKNLNVNNVNAKIQNRGDMHWDFAKGCYEVPKGSNIGSAYTSCLWIGGYDSIGALHEAAATYRQHGYDYFPGPLDEQTGQTDSITSYKFDRLWKTDQYLISEFQWQFAQGNVQNGSYNVPFDILEWPAIGNLGVTQGLAPFMDVNGNGIYDPLVGGDYPKIIGDQEIFWVFNDVLAQHSETFGSEKIGVEVQAHAYAFVCGNPNDSDKAINYTTFYNFDIINRSVLDYQNVTLGFYQDVDLGNWQNDFVGCLPQYNVGFCYNGDSLDPDNSAQNLGYNNFPPTQATVILNGPLAPIGDTIDNNNDGNVDEFGEKILMSGFINYKNSAPFDFYPTQTSDYINYLEGKWRDSTSLTYGGNGYGGVTPTKFIYPTFPDDQMGWNELSAGNIPYDRNQLISTGQFNFSRGDTIHYVVAMVTSFDSINNWNSHAFYQNMVSDVQKIQEWYSNSSIPSCFALFDGVVEPTSNPSSFLLYPNPATDKLTISYEPKSKNASVEIYSIDGKRIYSGMWLNLKTMTLPIENYARGIYFARIIDGQEVISQKFIKE